MKRLLVFILLIVVAKAVLLTLTGCGVSGAPEAPEPRPGVTFSGEARLGIGGRF
ncbi:MAG: hypothetical protein ACXIUV_13590 [Alkalilacustris sp.]